MSGTYSSQISEQLYAAIVQLYDVEPERATCYN